LTVSNWVNIGNAGFSPSITDNISLAVSPTGQPYVAFADIGNTSKATVMKFDGSTWVNEGTAGFSAGMALSINLSINPLVNLTWLIRIGEILIKLL